MGLPLLVKLSYAAVAFTSELLATFWGLYALHYLTDTAGLSPLLTGVLTIVYRLWDAVNDPLVGQLSDATNNNTWGKRRGWMLLGVFPYAIAYAAMWHAPPVESQVGLFFWFLAILFVADAGFTSVNVPHLALLADLTNDPQEKFSVNLYRSIFSGLGSLLSVVLIGVVSASQTEAYFGWEHRAGWFYLAALYSVLHCCVVGNCVFQTRGLSASSSGSLPIQSVGGPGRIIYPMKSVLRVHCARVAIFIFVVTTAAVQFTLACLSYLLLNVLGSTEVQMVGIVLTALVSAVISAVLVKSFGAKKEKRLILGIGSILWMSFYLVLPLIQGPDWYLYPLAALMGVGLAVSLVIPLAFVTDAADYVELETGSRYDGALFGLLQLFNKILLGILVLGFQLGLQFTGFEPGQDATEATKLVIQAGLAVPILLIASGMWGNFKIPITSADLLRVASELKSRRATSEMESLVGHKSLSTSSLTDEL